MTGKRASNESQNGVAGKVSRRDLFKMASPMGKVEINKSECSGCGLCAVSCPSRALNMTLSDGENYQLLFSHGRCDACGQCVQLCPEKCLKLEHTLELDKVNEPVVLFEGAVARCRECGRVLGSMMMIDKLRARILAAGQTLVSQLELCPECKSAGCRSYNAGKS